MRISFSIQMNRNDVREIANCTDEVCQIFGVGNYSNIKAGHTYEMNYSCTVPTKVLRKMLGLAKALAKPVFEIARVLVDKRTKETLREYSRAVEECTMAEIREDNRTVLKIGHDL